jgi:hypothetical protein
MTKYAIKRGDVFVKDHPSGFHWTESVERAMTFDSMSGAIGYATMHMGLEAKEFDIEILEGAIGE